MCGGWRLRTSSPCRQRGVRSQGSSTPFVSPCPLPLVVGAGPLAGVPLATQLNGLHCGGRIALARRRALKPDSSRRDPLWARFIVPVVAHNRSSCAARPSCLVSGGQLRTAPSCSLLRTRAPVPPHQCVNGTCWACSGTSRPPGLPVAALPCPSPDGGGRRHSPSTPFRPAAHAETPPLAGSHLSASAVDFVVVLVLLLLQANKVTETCPSPECKLIRMQI